MSISYCYIILYGGSSVYSAPAGTMLSCCLSIPTMATGQIIEDTVNLHCQLADIRS